MNKNQKKTFYLFLSLYLISSYILLATVAYFYHKSEHQLIHVDVHFNLHEKANDVMSKLALNNDYNLTNNNFSNDDISIEFIDKDANTIGEKSILYPKMILKTGTFDINKACMLVKKHISLNNKVWGIVLKDKTLDIKKEQLNASLFKIFSIIFILIGLIGFILSKLFLRPINNHIANLNNFIKDINHELNTPITSLIMSSKELDKNYDKKFIKNIIISTKQLYEIYKSLIVINFDINHDNEKLNLKDILEQSIEYFNEIISSKNIIINSDIEDTKYDINKNKIQIVFNNLLSNAIKYSYPNSKIDIELKNNILSIKDYGIGIKASHQKDIFNRYYKEDEHSQGFGIGLDTVRKICFEYDIKVDLNSIPNQYTIFTLEF